MAANDNVKQEAEKAEIVYKTKIVQFLGRSVPIILQNDNGPCPLLAICNVLLLRNNVSLSLDIAEVASSRLLSLVAERLLDSNSNIEDKNEEYACNQQQNISDALPLLHHLVTGLDVNVRFRNIHDFEFTPECAVFDLLDIGLVHGWLCDPQDEVTSKILAANSYNTLVEKLVELQATRADLQASASVDTIDFVAATTATLGVPSPSRAVLLKTKSFEDSDASEIVENMQRKGDAEESAQLLEVLKISSVEVLPNAQQELESTRSPEETVGIEDGVDNLLLAAERDSFSSKNSKEEWCLVPPDVDLRNLQSFPTMHESAECKQLDTRDEHGITGSVESVKDSNGPKNIEESKAASSNDSLPIFDDGGFTTYPAKAELEVLELQTRTHSGSNTADILKGEDLVEHEVIDHQNLGSVDLGCSVESGATATSFSASPEPLYEGEAEASGIESREPLYEGEASLARTEQIGIEEEGVIINSFLKINATQLTYYGLFCLQEGLKERELCVFFRNNHFSTMFKYNGDLYLLVTDQGYLNQPDIVWEKLDEVHGDTVLVTGTFTPFQAGESSGLWDEQGAIAATADYLSSQQQSDGTKESGVNNADLELAMSLQHQEFEQQQQQPQQPARSTTSVSVRQPQTVDSTMRADGSRLITGPKKSSYSYKPEAKTKCAIM